MKIFRKLLNSVKPHFEEGENLKNCIPTMYLKLFYSFLIILRNLVHIRDAIDLKRSMMTVIVAISRALFFGMWNINNIYYGAIGQEVDFSLNLVMAHSKCYL